MHRDKRQFRSIILSSPKIRNADAVLDFFPSGSLGEIEQFESPDNNTSLNHIYYLSDIEFSPGPMDEELIIRRGRKTVYKWSMYFGHFSLGRTTFLFVAVPFSRMAEEVFGIVNQASNGIGRVYGVPNLRSLSTYLAECPDSDGELIAKGVRFQVRGDSDVSTLSFQGADIFGSRTLKRSTKQLHGISLDPKRLKISHSTEIGSFGCEFDTYGNYWFRVSSGGESIFRFARFIGLLHKQQLLEEEPSFPLRKSVREIEEGAENADMVQK